MASGGLSSISAEVGHGRVRGGMASYGARLRSSGRDESRRGGEPWPTRRTAAISLGSARSSSARRALRRRKEDWDGTRGFEVVHEVKSGARTRWPTRGSSPPATVAGMASGVTVTNTVETLFLRLNDFCPSLTI